MDLHSLVLSASIVFGGSLLQGMAAFGFGLFTVPLFLAVGLPVPMILSIAATSTALQASAAVYQLRRDIPWKIVGISILVRAVTLVLGVMVLRTLTQSMEVFKFWVGAVVLGAVLLQSGWRPRPRSHLHPLFAGIAFLSSGFIGGLCSMGGPPLVLWVMAHDWAPAKTRGFLFASFMGLVPIQLLVLYSVFGWEVWQGFFLALALTPVTLLGSMVGLRVGARFSKNTLRRVAYAILLLIALRAMLPYLK